jgi:fumarate hydratase class I
VDYPAGGREADYISAIHEGTIEATKKQYLRPNAVNSLTGKNSENNVGVNAPSIVFSQWDEDRVRIRLLQKGGGSENCSPQYRIPDVTLGAGRDLDGVRKVVLDAAVKAQGQGCAPGIFCVAIGGDRASSAKLAKEQLFRKFGERSTEPSLAELEVKLLKDINTLGIGPMGFGGKTTALEVFIAVQDRHPATYFVSIAYCCWAFRSASMIIKGEEVSYD